MSERFDRQWVRLAAVGALVAALGLAGCGRRGPLDLPPVSKQATPEAVPTAEAPAPSPDYPQAAIDGSERPGPGIGGSSQAVAPPPSGQQRTFFLDWLVN